MSTATQGVVRPSPDLFFLENNCLGINLCCIVMLCPKVSEVWTTKPCLYATQYLGIRAHTHYRLSLTIERGIQSKCESESQLAIYMTLSAHEVWLRMCLLTAPTQIIECRRTTRAKKRAWQVLCLYSRMSPCRPSPYPAWTGALTRYTLSKLQQCVSATCTYMYMCVLPGPMWHATCTCIYMV